MSDGNASGESEDSNERPPRRRVVSNAGLTFGRFHRESNWQRREILLESGQLMDMEPKKRSLRAEPWLGGMALLLLLVGCFFVLKPFMTALMWAMILAYTLYPLQRIFTRWFRGYRTLAACLVSLTVTVMFAGPVVLIGLSLAEDGKEIASATRDWFMEAPEEAPTWLSGLPLVGNEIEKYWSGFTEDRKRWMDQIDKQVKGAPRALIVEDQKVHDAALSLPLDDVKVDELNQDAIKAESSHMILWIGRFLAWAKTGLLAAAKAVGQGVTEVLFSAFLAFFLLRDAPELSKRLGVAVERLAGERGQHLIKVAGGTVKGVIYGILGTALTQALVAGFGFWVVDVPGVVLLSVLVFFFAVVPFGPPLIWGPATLWLFAQGRIGAAVFMLIWGLAVISGVDNFLRPYLISQGSKMPFALIFCGVIGGALAFGLVGVFMGPTLLAVAFRLIDEWSAEKVDLVKDSADESISALLNSL